MESGVNPFLPAKMVKVLFYGWLFFLERAVRLKDFNLGFVMMARKSSCINFIDLCRKQTFSSFLIGVLNSCDCKDILNLKCILV